MAATTALLLALFLPFFLFTASHAVKPINVTIAAVTDPNDAAIIEAFRDSLENPELLKWPPRRGPSSDPCDWTGVFCSNGRVTQIQAKNLGLRGTLPPNLNSLSMLYNLGLQKNSLSGPLPSFSGLNKLQYAYLDNNQFDTIPSDFFDGLSSLQVLALDNNPLNKTSGGWTLPPAFRGANQLGTFSCSSCGIVGPLPDFFGDMPSLVIIRLAYNGLTGPIPAMLGEANLQTLQLNNQNGGGLTGPIDVLPSMASLVQVWLHGNSLSGTIPDNISDCASLNDLRLNNNRLTGIVPASLGTLKGLMTLKLDNNHFMGAIPDLKIGNYTYDGNSFCQDTAGTPCSPQVTALLDFLGGVNFPVDLATSWTGNDPCSGPWLGITCKSGSISLINLPNHNLTGTISPSLGKLDGLEDVRLDRNNLFGTIPQELADLKSLKMLNLTTNNLEDPFPKFSNAVVVLVDDQNPFINSPRSSPGGSSSGGKSSKHKRALKTTLTVLAALLAALIVVAAVLYVLYRHRKKKENDRFNEKPVVIYPKDPSDPEDTLKIVIAETAHRNATPSDHSTGSGSSSSVQVIQSGNLSITIQMLRQATGNFAPENELGRGGFGVVYKGGLPDGTEIAVKRMQINVVRNDASNEFMSEISVLSKVRHRNLVSLLGYLEDEEKLLVYEYMPQGALSRHLFQWKAFNLEPLSWKKRLNIALDVARGLEYLHSLAHQSFIHRDLKSANILLDNDFRAKIADFGLVKLAPDGMNSVATRLAGTFGYLAPEYAFTGKITTKADVFSFGVVLMELITGFVALDQTRPEESRYLPSWFLEVKSKKEQLTGAIDPTLEVTEETLESISVVAELAGHCAVKDPQQRPDMSHAVGVLSPLVKRWRPGVDGQGEQPGIDLQRPLLEMVKVWQKDDCANTVSSAFPDDSLASIPEFPAVAVPGSSGTSAWREEESSKTNSMNLDDSFGSLPARPQGFSSFTSSDGR